MTQRQETLIGTKPGHRVQLALKKCEGDIQQLTPTPDNNTQGFGEQMQNSNEVTQRCPQIYVTPPQNTNSLGDTGNKTTQMVFECELSVKLHGKDVEVGISSDRNP